MRKKSENEKRENMKMMGFTVEKGFIGQKRENNENHISNDEDIIKMKKEIGEKKERNSEEQCLVL